MVDVEISRQRVEPIGFSFSAIIARIKTDALDKQWPGAFCERHFLRYHRPISLSLSFFSLPFLVLFSLKFLLVHRFKSIHRVFIHSDSFPIQPPIVRVYRVSLCNFQADDKKKRPRDSCFTIALYLLYLVSHFHSIC